MLLYIIIMKTDNLRGKKRKGNSPELLNYKRVNYYHTLYELALLTYFYIQIFFKRYYTIHNFKVLIEDICTCWMLK